MSNSFIRKLALRAPLADEDIQALAAATNRPTQVDAGRDIVVEGSVPEFAYIILDGFACRYRIMPDGSRAIIAYLVPGDGCDLHGSILGHMAHSVGTLTQCTIAAVPYRTIKELAAYRPNVYLSMWWSVIVDESILREWLIGVGRRSADRQVAHFLCEVLARLQAIGMAHEPNYRLPLTQSDLADTAGLSHVHVHRVLANLRKSGLLESRRKGLIVRSLDDLTEFAGFDPGYLYLTGATKTAEPPSILSEATRAEYERRFR